MYMILQQKDCCQWLNLSEDYSHLDDHTRQTSKNEWLDIWESPKYGLGLQLCLIFKILKFILFYVVKCTYDKDLFHFHHFVLQPTALAVYVS